MGIKVLFVVKELEGAEPLGALEEGPHS